METALTAKQYKLAVKLLRLFKIKDQPVDKVATPGQIELFGRIVFKVSLRQHIQCLTQYGKSLFTAFALIILTGMDPEQGDHVIVGAPTEEKSKIIMRYYQQHLGDSPLFAPLLSADTKLERLRQETTKDSLILKNGGIMQVFTLNAGDSKKGFEAAMGQGADDVIMDEACLIPDNIESTVIRMGAGRSESFMYVKIGNPWYTRTHFQGSYRDPRYLKLTIDYHQALREGRITPDFIDEVRGKPYFDILYECKFPSEAQFDSKGYTALYKEALLDLAYLDEPLTFMGDKALGCDVSHGGANFSTIVLRANNQAQLKFRAQTEDELILLTEIEKICKANGMPLCDRIIHIDEIGSQALCARANELWSLCGAHGHNNKFGVNVGARADQETKPNGEPMVDEKTGKPIVIFMNLRAQLAWRGHEWVQRGGKLIHKPDFDELLVQRYKIQSDKKIKMKSKEELMDEGIKSPDVADAFNLTFVKKQQAQFSREVQQNDAPMTAFGV